MSNSFAKTAALMAAVALVTTPALAGGTHGKADKPEIGAPGKAAHADRIIDVSLTDNAYSLDQLSVRDGETITFRLSNDGEFLHEFNVGTPKMHQAHQDEMMEMLDSGMMSMEKKPKGKGHADPNSILLEPGETAEFTWTFAKTETLEFACNVPGHYQSGMVGTVSFDGEVAPSGEAKS